MVISDINILCLSQKEPSQIVANGICVDVIDKRDVVISRWKDRKFSQWLKLFKKGCGVWYEISPSARDAETDKAYEDEFFDLEIIDGEMRVMPYPKYLNDIQAILRQLVEDSPERSILLFIRLGNTTTTSKQEITPDEAIEALNEGKLQFEVFYHIQER